MRRASSRAPAGALAAALLVACAAAQIPGWQQCGGTTSCPAGDCRDGPWMGAMCTAGYSCRKISDAYWHCADDAVAASAPPSDLQAVAMPPTLGESPMPTSSGLPVYSAWKQCGGKGNCAAAPDPSMCGDRSYATCTSGYYCHRYDPYYWQCIPGSGSSSGTPVTPPVKPTPSVTPVEPVKPVVPPSVCASVAASGGKCGPSNGNACCPAGQCCSTMGECGTGANACGTGRCNLAYSAADSLCNKVSPPAPKPAPNPTPVPPGTCSCSCAKRKEKPKLPPGNSTCYYTVKSGDTLERIAAFWCLTPTDLLRLSGMTDTSAASQPGTRIRVPCKRPSDGCGFKPVDPEKKPCRHTLRTGESLEMLAEAYCISVQHLKAMNPGMSSATRGQDVYVPCSTDAYCRPDKPLPDCKYTIPAGHPCGLRAGANPNGCCAPGTCCSKSGVCGRTDGTYMDPYCGEGCQSKFGQCGDQTKEEDFTICRKRAPPGGLCGPENGYACCPDDECCSADGVCSKDANACGPGCKKGYGKCSLPDKNPWEWCKVTVPAGGTCGKDGYCCANGLCCSKEGICGATSKYCQNCQPGYGECWGEGDNKLCVKEALPGGRCGNGTCCGSGECCSVFGHCGLKDVHCANCQKAWSAKDSACETSVVTDECVCSKGRSQEGGPCGKDAKKCCAQGLCCGPTNTCSKSSNACGHGYCQQRYGECRLPPIDDPANDPRNKCIGTAVSGGRCGPEVRLCCPNGECCGANGRCGIASKTCGIEFGCQELYGSKCLPEKPVDPSDDDNDKPGGTCGPKYGNRRCMPGECCSHTGECGLTEKHCKHKWGCLPEYGDCHGIIRPKPIPIPYDPQNIPEDPTVCTGQCCKTSLSSLAPAFGLCGVLPMRGMVCCPPGQCCSANGQCGVGPGYCGPDCDPRFGDCATMDKDDCVNADECSSLHPYHCASPGVAERCQCLCQVTPGTDPNADDGGDTCECEMSCDAATCGAA